MPTYRFPILVWQDAAGFFTACPVEGDENVAGTGPSAHQAARQLQEYLAWAYKEKSWLPEPDLLDPQIASFKVAVRPEYHEGDRVYPADETFQLRVLCVHGRQNSGLLTAALPTLGLRFYYYEAAALKGLVTRSVQQKLQGLTVQQLSRYLPPRHAKLDEGVVRLPRREPRPREEAKASTLSRVAERLDLRTARKSFARAWERDPQVADVVKKLHEEGANVLLVGEPGAGKTTVLVEAVRQVARQSADDRTRRQLWLTSAARLIAGMKYLGQWEERCEQVIAELAQHNGILCVENLLDLVRTGGVGPGDSVAAFFRPYLQRGELRLAAEATAAELDACRRLLPGLVELFQPVHLPDFGRPQVLAILDRLTTSFQQNLQVALGKGVVDLVYHLFRRFAPYAAFPGKATAFMRELFDRAHRQRRPEVTTDQVIEQFVRRTGLPELFLRDEVPLGHAEVVETFRRQVIGQDDACRVAADLVTTFKAGLNDPGRPVGVLLFCGPTGVGKTELARAVARFFFGHGEQPDRLLRLDMSEYAGPDSAERLLGPPAGEPSDLIKKVRQQPFVVLLLDEIEKASPEVFDVLLSVFDEGRLTDRYGRPTVFRSAVIIMTSNLGAHQAEAFGFRPQAGVPYDAEARKFFRPEFFNRIDAVVTFHALGPETIHAITCKELSEIARREGLARAGLRLTWTDRLVAHLARQGFDRRYGARPLQRTLEDLVVTPLARYLLDHPEVHGTAIAMDLSQEGKVIFHCEAVKNPDQGGSSRF